MGYKVITQFKDLQDKSRVYQVGDKFPATKRKVSVERLDELSGDSNKLGKPVIEKEGE